MRKGSARARQVDRPRVDYKGGASFRITDPDPNPDPDPPSQPDGFELVQVNSDLPFRRAHVAERER